jgi:hypothetical protein
MTGFGPSRRFAATLDVGRARTETDIGLDFMGTPLVQKLLRRGAADITFVRFKLPVKCGDHAFLRRSYASFY